MWGLQYDNSRVPKKFLTISGAEQKRRWEGKEQSVKAPACPELRDVIKSGHPETY